ncbi:metalloregulator ArsR/SmtB family transcription factor [Bifidobacterium pullorum]|uniref:metalloregulator ArsR/SmtB family transcription factor n=1 Tax=Bifidobacterium pullorum TaxID=78448 RepID=UPI0023AB0760|nr:metalloregulator ArsR/SmtB family transcription factor [Bifidobacterium pullorum]
MGALDDPVRQRVLEALRARTMEAGELAREVGVQPSRLSYHLNRLKEAELVTAVRRGNHIQYELNASILDETIMWLVSLRERGGVRQPAECRAERMRMVRRIQGES